MKNVRILQAKKAAAIQSAKTINDNATDRDLTAEEAAQFDAHMNEAKSLDARITRAQDLAAQDVGSSVEIVGNVITVSENLATDPKVGFLHVGDFMQSVHAAASAGRNGVSVDKRLLINAAAPGSFASEGSGIDGGFIIPPAFSGSIFDLSITNTALLPLTDQVTVNGNGMDFPTDLTTPWGTNGVRAYWQGEATAGVATKPVFGMAQLRLKKMMALVPVSEEMLTSGAALASYLPRKIGASMQWKINEAILSGAGGNQPAGALTSGAVVTVAKDSGQAANTLSAANLAGMIARLPEGSYANSVWVMNNDVLPALFGLVLGNIPMYMPSGIKGNPYGTLLGRPIIISQHANTFSAQGDVMLLDLSYYQTITKVGGPQTAVSMHLYFDADVSAFRTTFRIDGQSKLSAAISPAKGSNKLSPFVQLAAR